MPSFSTSEDAPSKTALYELLCPRDRSDLAAMWIVMSGWAALTLGSLIFVFLLGVNVPLQDDFRFVDVLSGEHPATPGWLFARHNGHLFPLTRLMLLGIARATNFDMRPGLYLSGAVLSASGLIAILLARWLRGRTSIFDLILPLFLVSLTHAWNLIQGVGLSFALYLLLFLILAAGFATAGYRSTAGAVGLMVCLTLLALNGGYGAAASIVWVPFIVWTVLRERRLDPITRLGGWPTVVLLTGTGLTVAAIVIHAIGLLEGGPSGDQASSLLSAPATAVRAMGMGWGVLGQDYDTEHFGAVLAALLTLTLPALFFGWRAMRSAPRASPAPGALLTAVIASVAVAFAIALGRSGLEVDAPGTFLWYATLMAPLPCGLYTLYNYSPSSTLRVGISAFLLLSGIAAVKRSAENSIPRAIERRSAAIACFRDAQDGASPEDLLTLYHHNLLTGDRDVSLSEVMRTLEKHRQGPYDPHQSWWPMNGADRQAIELPLTLMHGQRTTIEALAKGTVELAGGDVVLSAQKPDARFLLPGLGSIAEEDRYFELTLLSPVKTRLRVYRDDPDDEKETLTPIVDEPVEQGRNVLQFVVRGDPEGDSLQMALLEGPANYRLNDIRVRTMF